MHFTPSIDNTLACICNNRQCKAIFAYLANEPDELTIAEGDIIRVIDQSDSDWWKGLLGDNVGVFPSAYVELI